MKNKIWKDVFQKKWMVWICGPNVVYYVKATRNGFKWVTIDEMDDVRECLYFDEKTDVQAFINMCIAKGKLPSDETCERLEYCLVMPSLEDGKFWYEDAGKSYNRYLKGK